MANKDNPGNGSRFELAVAKYLRDQGMHVQKDFAVHLGTGAEKRPHRFDLGSDSPKVVVECKRHTWTATGNAPSAKMAVWNEAMYYFHLAPPAYRKMLFVLLHRFDPECQTLLNYYIGRFRHLIPAGVEVWEFDDVSGKAECAHHERAAN